MIIQSRPTADFLGTCEPCVRPIRGRDDHASGRYARLVCPECGGPARGERLHATTNGDPCDGRCMSAVGPSCSCGCGGVNHGRLWLYAGEETETALIAYRERMAEGERERAQRAAAERRRVRAVFDAWAEAHRDVVDFLGDGADFEPLGENPNGFLWDMAEIVNRPRPLTDNQTAAVWRCLEGRRRYLERVAAEKANARPVPTGDRVTLTGEIVYTRVEDNPYGGVRSSMLVKGDGWKVWCSIPQSLASAVGCHVYELKGRHVRFVAAVSAATDDASMGYAKRPRKAELITPVGADG